MSTAPIVTQGVDEIMVENARALTARQRLVLEFIHGYSQSHGYPPTIREIAAVLGIRSTNGVKDHLVSLERKGALTASSCRARGLRITPRGLTEIAGGEARVEAEAEDVARKENLVPRALLVRTSRLLSEIAPRAPLLEDIRKEIGR